MDNRSEVNSAIRRLSIGLFSAGLTGVLAIVVWQWLVWLPQAGAWSKGYIWQRCGFAVLTAVDWPVVQITGKRNLSTNDNAI